jgi:phenylalanyl-tRNA synthetase beta chain
MKVLERWLKHYIDFSLPPGEMAERLTMLGLEFEHVERLDTRYKGFVVGEVLTKEKHPNADKLSVCTVNVGSEVLQLVCGAPNVAAGQKVVVGLVGATVPRNLHDPGGSPLVLAKVKIRGIESSGMICSESELDFGKDADGIMILDSSAPVGTSLASYYELDDVAFDVEITPNRPDWLSHFGVAREIAVLTGKLPVLPGVRLRESKEPVARHLSVTVENSRLCPRFAARMIKGVKIAPSPRWLQNALRNAGLRPRNNIVDITNYVMYECGHPMHAFDYELLRGGRIIVRAAQGGESFRTLDGKSHILPAGTAMVCDGEREVSIAGVMGGENSEISDATVDIVLESAYWDPSSIRRTAKLLGISSDASQRFERGADPNGVRYALDRAAQLVLQLAGGSLLKGVIDVYPKKIRERAITVRLARVNGVLGTSMKSQDVVRMLRILGLSLVSSAAGTMKFRIPTFRVDLDREIDLIEEVARVYGYDKIEEKAAASVSFVHPFPTTHLRDEVRNALIGQGYQEAITNSMTRGSIAGSDNVTPIRILNPQNADMDVLRTSILPGLLETVARNQNLGNFNLRLFEIGHVFRIDETPAPKLVENFLEEERVCFLCTGMAEPVFWGRTARGCDLFDLKGSVEDLLAKFALDKGRFISYSTTNGLTENTLTIEIQGGYAGYLGQIRKGMLKQFGIENDVFVAELLMPALQRDVMRKYIPLSRYPRVRRDVAFIVDAGIPAEKILRTMKESATELLETVELFDMYEGDPLPAGKKSVAFTLELMSRVKTLTDPEIEAAVKRVVERVEKEQGATLRSMG